METQTLNIFVAEAQTYTPMIRNGVLVCSQEGNLGGELETALLYTQVIKDAAAAVGLTDVARTGEHLSDEFKKVLGKSTPLTGAETRALLDQLAQLEAQLAKMQLGDDEFSDKLEGFVDQQFKNHGWESPVIEPSISPETHDSAGLGFEIDDEMLEIFAEEAEELLRSMGEHLDLLRAEPDKRESLLEIRRNAHTLKGSAGIVGIQPLSDLAHRVEDLLDYLADNEIAGNRKVFELLNASTDCLSSLAHGDKSAQLADRIGLIYKEYDSTLQALNDGTFGKDEAPAPPAAETAIPKPTAPPMEAATAPAPEPNQITAGGKSVVRVSLDKLDELVRLVGDLVISRSVFEQRLVEFERQVNELQHTTGRLMRATGKLETDFEASMLEAPGSNFGVAGIPSARNNGSNAKFDSLELDRYTDFHQTVRELLETASDSLSINTELETLQSNLGLLFDNQSALIEEMHDKLLRLRMVKFGALTSRLQRTVRVTCEQEQKEAELVIEGGETEVDNQIVDLLIEPLLHLLRNSVAHGIEAPSTRRLLGKPETGRIHLKLHSEGTHIIMSVSDDGRGISAVALREKAVRNGFISQAEADQMSDADAFSLGFLPGISTAESISQTAGRGVGMNIVKQSVLRGQGTIAIASEPQKGTTFTIRMPMALAITRGLLVKTSGRTFTFPLKLVKQVTEITAQEYAKLPDRNLIALGGTAYSVANLGALLKLPQLEVKRDYVPLILLETLDSPCALTVDEILRAEEIVIKPLTAPLQNYANLLGACIVGDGNVVPVLDLIQLLKHHFPVPKPQFLQLETPPMPKFVQPVMPPPADILEIPEPVAIVEPDVYAENEPAPVEVAATPMRIYDDEPYEDDPPATTVMIVDDSPSVRHITSKLIKNVGWEVILAKDGLEALEALQSAEKMPEIILSDVEMPRMDGYELLTAIRETESLRHLPVIMITSRASVKHQERAYELGVTDYLTKPFDDTVLIERIKELTAVEQPVGA